MTGGKPWATMQKQKTASAVIRPLARQHEVIAFETILILLSETIKDSSNTVLAVPIALIRIDSTYRGPVDVPVAVTEITTVVVPFRKDRGGCMRGIVAHLFLRCAFQPHVLYIPRHHPRRRFDNLVQPQWNVPRNVRPAVITNRHLLFRNSSQTAPRC